MMDNYRSTRGGPGVTLADALFAGLAPDGGLYLPSSVPPLGAPSDLGPSFVETAEWAAQSFLGAAIGSEQAAVIATGALDLRVPLIEIEEGVHILELFHGPTMAFKDVGARFMAHLMSALEPAEPTATPRTVLVATSGDTGGAVAAAFHGRPGYRVVVLFPARGVSDRQRRQMTTLGGNVRAVAVDGTFDDCQRLAKAAFEDPDLAERHRFTSANSINIGRLLPQAFYYIHAARTLGWTDAPSRFVVPCGNLGNLFAGLLAQSAGMPTGGFLAASNANDAFPEFLRTGEAPTRPSRRTISNAMDVGVPSNLERIVRWFDDDREALRGHVSAHSVSDAETRTCMADVHARTGYLLDPHTAVAYAAWQKDPTMDGPTVLLATAHPAKFPEVVREATGVDLPIPSGLERAMRATETIDTMPASLQGLSVVLNRES